MASLASQWETKLDVINGCGRRVVVLLVTAHAGGIGAGQVVIVIDVTLRALCARQVEASQRPASSGVIKLPIRPEHRVVTLLTSSRESGLDVIHRRSCIVVVGLMAAHASGICAAEVVIVVDVALRALRAGQVEPSERPARR